MAGPRHLDRRPPRGGAPGAILLALAALFVAFALVRIPIDMTRAWEPEATLLRFGAWGVTESQLTSLAMALFGLLMMVRIRRSAAARA